VQRIVDGALREHGLHLVLEAGDIDLTDLERHYDARGGRFEILEAPGGEPLGVVGWRLAGGGVCELKKLYLASAARGRGLGRLALDRAIAAARACGCRCIVLETAAVLERANRLYRAAGFVPVCGADAGPFAALTEQCDLAYRLELT
jgi:GNAT superfamily N-acetyltransferase